MRQRDEIDIEDPYWQELLFDPAVQIPLVDVMERDFRADRARRLRRLAEAGRAIVDGGLIHYQPYTQLFVLPQLRQQTVFGNSPWRADYPHNTVPLLPNTQNVRNRQRFAIQRIQQRHIRHEYNLLNAELRQAQFRRQGDLPQTPVQAQLLFLNITRQLLRNVANRM